MSRRGGRTVAYGRVERRGLCRRAARCRSAVLSGRGSVADRALWRVLFFERIRDVFQEDQAEDRVLIFRRVLDPRSTTALPQSRGRRLSSFRSWRSRWLWAVPSADKIASVSLNVGTAPVYNRLCEHQMQCRLRGHLTFARRETDIKEKPRERRV